jgi:hypothetical protein
MKGIDAKNLSENLRKPRSSREVIAFWNGFFVILSLERP